MDSKIITLFGRYTRVLALAVLTVICAFVFCLSCAGTLLRTNNRRNYTVESRVRSTGRQRYADNINDNEQSFFFRVRPFVKHCVGKLNKTKKKPGVS